MKAAGPKVCLSLVNWNTPDLTILCIKACRLQSLKPDLIIVVDNKSSDNSASLIESELQEGEKLIRNSENAGFAGGHLKAINAIEQDDFDLIWLLNSDTLPHEDALQSLVEAYNDKGQHLFGSLILDSKGGRIVQGYLWRNIIPGIEPSDGSTYPGLKSGLHAHEAFPDKRKVVEIGALQGSSMMIPLKLISRFGFLDNNFFMYGEETSYSLELSKKGIRTYLVADSIVSHAGAHSSTTPKLKEVMTYYRKRNWLYTYIKAMPFYHSFPVLAKEILDSVRSYFGIATEQSFKTAKQRLAVWHVLIRKRGKVLPPENYR